MEIYIKIYIFPENYGNIHLLWKYTLKYTFFLKIMEIYIYYGNIH